MSNTLILKRSASPNAVPTDTQLTYGELAINYLDGNLFYKNYNDQVVTIASNKFVSVSGNITGGNLISSGLITTSSNIAGGNITISGVVSATGNITGNNVVAGNNLTAGNVISGGIVSSTGNIIGNNFLTFGQVSASGNVSGDYILGNASQMTGVVAFKTITVPSYPNLVANTSGVLNIEAGPNVFISTDSANGTLFIDAATVSGLWTTGGTMGLITEAPTEFYDFDTVTVAAGTFYDLGFIVSGGIVWPSQFKLPAAAVFDLPPGAPAGSMVFVTDAAGGSIPAFSDGINWRRVDDRNIIA